MIEEVPLPIWKQIITVFTIVVYCPPETVYEMMEKVMGEGDIDD